jgi:hypothetical protein
MLDELYRQYNSSASGCGSLAGPLLTPSILSAFVGLSGLKPQPGLDIEIILVQHPAPHMHKQWVLFYSHVGDQIVICLVYA